MAVQQALNDLLRSTSRSFYLTLRVLPRAIRPQIGLAYLLARTTDTIADTEIVPAAQRIHALQILRERILGWREQPGNFRDLIQNQNSSAEKLLLEKIEDSLAALKKFSEADRKLIREVLKIITSGQELDLQRFGGRAQAPTRGDARPTDKIVALETDAQLDDYTYRVAGCVGEFWTKMCRAHLFPTARIDEKQFLIDAVRFGKGLQLVNILRDLPADLNRGCCYLPAEKLEPLGLYPNTLLSPTNESKFLPLFHKYLDEAESHLRAGWNYTNTIPFSQFRVRLACAWPILIGVKTLNKLRAATVGDLQERVKISRGEIHGIIFKSLLTSPFPFLWRKLLT